MSRVEVLVATMNQTDLSLFNKMNIQTDVIFCNQTDKNEFIETEINGCRVRMLSTKTRGVGVNRNLAILLSDAEFCLCADDDIVYINEYEKLICSEFEKHKDVDVIQFNRIETDKSMAHNKKPGYTRGGAGACRVAFRNKIIKEKNILFSTVFGGGAKYSSGEDSLFAKDVIKKGSKIYVTDKPIGELIAERESTWFNGYTDKFFFDKGAWCKAAYSHTWRLLKYHLIFVFRNKGEQSIIKKIKLMNQGAKAYIKLNTYQDTIRV